MAKADIRPNTHHKTLASQTATRMNHYFFAIGSFENVWHEDQRAGLIAAFFFAVPLSDSQTFGNSLITIFLC